ncbi:uncharacterized protein SRS1_12906 [Sporisorium reilianum f. sp. reilianum]|uniref:Uncharacterized protein n=1 Tax=Sporisorium reilianum f. sp. reilianum TaxID=72559 RepID=A0A2N8UB21_9BASI|nr:uncharacterized protein SRS1_12906 [Sporisorium reilianum f. sp. reilianum]
MATSLAQAERAAAAIQSSNRRRGWVIASEDGTEVQRPSSFDARKSAAAWNKGKGPSKASIPSRASSLASSPAPSPALQSEPFQQLVPDAPSTVDPISDAGATPTQPVPPPRDPSSSMSHNRDASSSTGRRRPSPPLLVPPKQTFRKVPSTRVLPPSALSDHQKFMSAASRSSASSNAASPSMAGPSGSRSPLVTAALRSDLAKLAASRRANSSSSSSGATTSSADTVIQSATTSATTTSAPSTAPSSDKGKGKQMAHSPLQTDAEGFFSSGGKVKQMVNTYDSGHGRQWSGGASMASQQGQPDRTQPKQSLISLTNPLPPLSEKSANSVLDDALSSASDLPSDHEAANPAAARPAKRRDSLQIELPPPPPQFKDRYPSILVDSTHASDSEASGTSNGGPRRRRRRSTASTSNKLGGDGEDDDDDEYADDDSSWPSTPSTTPLEMYFTAADANAAAAEARPRGARRTMQTTKEIITPVPDALGMGRPMVVVTSPSTASEVSSDRRSSSGSGSTSDRTYSSSPPAVASIAPAPALSKIEEHPAAKPDIEVVGAAASKTSLSFEVPDVPRSRASQENLSGGAAPVRSPSRTRAFLAKISPGRSANRSSVDLVSTTQPNTSAEMAKRMSLDSQRRTSAEQRRSVELRPILLNATPRPPARPAAVDLATADASHPTANAQQAQQQQRRSSVRVAIRPNVVPYHSRRSSEVSVGSSTDSHRLHDRASFDKETFDPRFSPASQVTALTMPSPALSTMQMQFPAQQVQQVKAVRAPVEVDVRRSSSAAAPKDRFAASMPSLHEPPRGVNPAARRSGSQEEAEGRPSAIRLLVDSHKGRMTRDNDSTAEWISVSVNDLPLPDTTQAYGNGGAGEFSNETQQHGKKAKKTKPWKLGRFAASEVVLPAKEKRRSLALVKRASSSQVNEAGRASNDSTPSPHKGPFMRNLGFTTANRNVVLQNLCAERSVLALGASTVYIAGSGRVSVPQPSAWAASKAKARLQVNKDKKPRQPSQTVAAPVVEPPIAPPRPSHSVELSQDAYLNVTEDRHTGYDLSGAAVGTVKSMVPELGDWSGSSGMDRGASEETMEVQPFRDYEDEGSDLFDSERSESESESEDEMEYDEEEVEVPVRFGQRVNLAQRYSSQAQSGADTAAAPRGEASSSPGTPSQVTPSVSLERLTPGTAMLHKNELRICVEEEEVPGRPARPWAYWKAAEVQQAKPQPEEAVEHQVRRQPSSKAMKLEQEVATGIFAAFVGNRSPRRQAQRSSSDAGTPSKVVSKELVVSKVNKSMFGVRSETRSTSQGTEQVVEIVRRHGSSHAVQESGSSRASVPLDKVERAFPSSLLSNGDFAHSRARSNRTDGSQSTFDDAVERITMRIEQYGGRGISASFTTREGQHWSWSGSKLEASVLSPRRSSSDVQGLDGLEGYDLVLRASDGSETVELATYSTESQVRNALGLFKPRTKAVPKPLPEDTSSIGPVAPAPARVLPLAIPMRSAPGPMSRAEPQVPMRGIRGGPLLRPQPSIAGSPRQHGLWQHQRAAISNEVVVQVHNNAVNDARASLLLNGQPANSRVSLDSSRGSMDEGMEKLGVLTFGAAGSVDRDLVVLSLLAVMGSARG